MKCHYVDERVGFFAILEEKLGEGFTLQQATLEEREKLLACDVLLTSLPSREDSGFAARFERLEKLVRNPASVPVVAFLSTTDRQVVRMAWSAGAYDYFVESGSLEELRLVLRRATQYYELQREVEQLRSSAARLTDFVTVVGSDEKMRAIYSFASKVAASDATVLISGETGTGKELLAGAIHRSSARAREPFVAVACSSLPTTVTKSVSRAAEERSCSTSRCSS